MELCSCGCELCCLSEGIDEEERRGGGQVLYEIVLSSISLCPGPGWTWWR